MLEQFFWKHFLWRTSQRKFFLVVVTLNKFFLDVKSKPERTKIESVKNSEAKKNKKKVKDKTRKQWA